MIRVIATGSAAVGANASSLVSTFTRLAKEVCTVLLFVEDNTAGITWPVPALTAAPVVVAGVWWHLETVAADQTMAKLYINNADAGGIRTVRWALVGISQANTSGATL